MRVTAVKAAGAGARTPNSCLGSAPVSYCETENYCPALGLNYPICKIGINFCSNAIGDCAEGQSQAKAIIWIGLPWEVQEESFRVRGCPGVAVKVPKKQCYKINSFHRLEHCGPER